MVFHFGWDLVVVSVAAETVERGEPGVEPGTETEGCLVEEGVVGAVVKGEP